MKILSILIIGLALLEFTHHISPVLADAQEVLNMLKYLRTHEAMWVVMAFSTLSVIAGCSSKPTSQSQGSANSNHITGAGSSFVFPVMTQWITTAIKRVIPE